MAGEIDSSGDGGLLDIARTLQTLAPIFLGSPLQTVNTTSSPGAIANAQAGYNTAMANAVNPNMTQNVVSSIMRVAAQNFAPVTAQQTSAGLYNSSTLQMLQNQAMADAAQQSSAAVLNYQTQQQQIATANSGDLLKALSTRTAVQQPSVPTNITTALTGGLAAYSLMDKLSNNTSNIKSFLSNPVDSITNAFEGTSNVPISGGTSAVGASGVTQLPPASSFGVGGEFGGAGSGTTAQSINIANTGYIADPTLGAGSVADSGGIAVDPAIADSIASSADTASLGSGTFDVAGSLGSDGLEGLSTAGGDSAVADSLGLGANAAGAITGDAAGGISAADSIAATADVGGVAADAGADASADAGAGIASDATDAVASGADAGGAGIASIIGDAGGVAGGAALGGLIGSQFGEGTGNEVATGVGAAAGAGIGADLLGILPAAVSWIVCTELVRQGKMPLRHYILGAKVFASYWEYGKRGYYLWAIPAVIHLRAYPSSRLSKLLCYVFTARAEYIAAIKGCRSARRTFIGWCTYYGLWYVCALLAITVCQFVKEERVNPYKAGIVKNG